MTISILMKIIANYSYACEPAIHMLEVHGDITGQEVFKLEGYLYTCLDEGRYCQLINMRQVKKIDGLGMYVLKKAVSRGMQIRLFNVGGWIWEMLMISGNEGCVKIYHETDSNKIVSCFKKDIKEKERDMNEGIKKRCSPRINTFFPARLSYSPYVDNDSVISCRANILNLSEEGLLAESITTFYTRSGEIARYPGIRGQGLCDLEFGLDGSSEIMETQGECVWETRNGHRVYAGIQFRDMKQDKKDAVKTYIYNALQMKASFTENQ